MARVLLISALTAGLALGALAPAGAPGGPWAVPAAEAATGDRWIWPGPPNVRDSDPAFFDQKRHALTLVHYGPSVLWTLSPEAPRTWSPRPAQGQDIPSNAPRFYDPAGDRLLSLDFDYLYPETCCAVTVVYAPRVFRLDAPVGWVPVPVRGPALPARDYSMSAYDSRRSRLLVWGGLDPETRHSPSRVDALDFTGDSASWSGFDLDAPPVAVRGAFAAYDSASDRLIAFGGRDSNGVACADVYSLDLGAPAEWERWPLADTVSTRAAGTFLPRLLVDPVRQRLLFVTATYAPRPGAPPYSPPRDSLVVWQLDLATRSGWTPVPYPGPSPDVSGGLVSYDPERNRLEVYGSLDRDDLDELVLDGGSPWTRPQVSDQVPYLGDGMHVLLDRKRERLIVLPGEGRGSGAWVAYRGITDTWEQCAWTTDGPASRPFGCAVFDSATDKGYLFGGGDSGIELGDLWQFGVDDSNRIAWQRLFPDGDTPSPRYGASAVFDPVRRRMIVFGGYAGRALGDTWELSLGPPVRWRRLPDRGVLPSARFLASAVYDSRRDGMLLYGGNAGSFADRQLLNDTFELSFADGDVWVPLSAYGRVPPPRFGHAAVYDARRDRMIVLWGAAYNGGRIDCAELDLADGPTWRDFNPSGLQLVGRGFFTALYDPDRDQALLFGGEPAPGFGGDAVFPEIVYTDFSGNPITSPPPLTGPPLSLLGFAPNPTRDVENVAFDLPVDADVRARLYDAAGRLVRDLGRKHYVAGRHLLLWDGKNDHGEVPPAGVYFARLSMLGKDFSGKFVLLH